MRNFTITHVPNLSEHPAALALASVAWLHLKKSNHLIFHEDQPVPVNSSAVIASLDTGVIISILAYHAIGSRAKWIDLMYTVPDVRTTDVSKLVGEAAVNIAIAEGCLSLYSAVAIDNVTSQRSTESFGANKVGTIYSLPLQTAGDSRCN